MRKVGKVINTEKNKVFIVTKNNDFIILQRNERPPIKGELYAGEVYKKPHYIRNIILTLVFFASIIALIQYTNYSKPALSLIVKMNASVKIELNASNKIVQIEPINTKGKTVVSNLKLKKKSIDEGLKVLLDECIKQKIVDEEFKKSNNIYIYLSNNYTDVPVDFSQFKDYAKEKNLKVVVNNDGEGKIE